MERPQDEDQDQHDEDEPRRRPLPSGASEYERRTGDPADYQTKERR